MSMLCAHFPCGTKLKVGRSLGLGVASQPANVIGSSLRATVTQSK